MEKSSSVTEGWKVKTNSISERAHQYAYVYDPSLRKLPS